MKLLIAIGFWEDVDSAFRFPHPRNLVDESWESERRASIVTYLRSGVALSLGMGYSHCRFPDGPPPEEMGNADLTDGKYLWPEGLHVYVSKYHVRLPDWFVSDMARARFCVPARFALPRGRPPAIDYSMWIEWASAFTR